MQPAKTYFPSCSCQKLKEKVPLNVGIQETSETEKTAILSRFVPIWSYPKSYHQ